MKFLMYSVIALGVLLPMWAIAGPAVPRSGQALRVSDVMPIHSETASGHDRARQDTIEIRSIPSGASVFLDGNPKGQTPVRIPGVSLGPHSLELKMKGYFDFPTTIQVAERNEPFIYTLRQPAILRVNSNVPYAEVWIEDQNYGTTPFEQPIEPGKYSVRLISKYVDSVVVVRLVEGKQEEVVVNVVPPPVMLEIEVVPPTAGVTVDNTGLQVQDGKASMTIQPGKHTLTVALAGYSTEKREMVLEPWKNYKELVMLGKEKPSNLIYYLAGGGAVLGGILYFVLSINGDTTDPYGRPPSFPDPTK
jgi:hypothetical protein